MKTHPVKILAQRPFMQMHGMKLFVLPVTILSLFIACSAQAEGYRGRWVEGAGDTATLEAINGAPTEITRAVIDESSCSRSSNDEMKKHADQGGKS